MARSSVRLQLDPDLCDRCGRCIDVCEPGVLKVGASYIFVDWRACTQCYACVKACDRGAITKRAASGRAATAVKAGSDNKGRAAKSVSNAKRQTADTKAASGSARSIALDEPWTPLEAIALLAAVFAALMLNDTLLSSPSVSEMTPTSAVFVRVMVLSVFYAIQVGVLWLLSKRRGAQISSAFALGRLRTSFGSKSMSMGLVLALLAGTRAASWIYAVIAQELGFDPPTGLGSNITSAFGPDTVGLLLSVVLVVIVAPLIEEIVFRGVLLEAFDSRIPPLAANVAQASLFALYHFTPWLLVPTFVLGLATGWIARARESLWPAIILHSLYNAVPVAIAFWLAAQG